MRSNLGSGGRRTDFVSGNDSSFLPAVFLDSIAILLITFLLPACFLRITIMQRIALAFSSVESRATGCHVRQADWSGGDMRRKRRDPSGGSVLYFEAPPR
ncbi:hypothetical protein BaRGS_00039860 [Batillaria attramentaria]|uniref:Uncharacterized protein n=1 Tax=Batillaria attramentaria TaxID=370345 RepID=A0ABD0J2K8_9CAEN